MFVDNLFYVNCLWASGKWEYHNTDIQKFQSLNSNLRGKKKKIKNLKVRTPKNKVELSILPTYPRLEVD